jgi:hypothetical protein
MQQYVLPFFLYAYRLATALQTQRMPSSPMQMAECGLTQPGHVLQMHSEPTFSRLRKLTCNELHNRASLCILALRSYYHWIRNTQQYIFSMCYAWVKCSCLSTSYSFAILEHIRAGSGLDIEVALMM